MSVTDVIATAAIVALASMGVALPAVLAIRAIRARHTFDRLFLLIEAVGLILFVLLQFELFAHSVVPDSAMPSWVSGPLEGYGSAMAWSYKTSVLVPWTACSTCLFLSGAAASPPRKRRASRQRSE